MKEIQDLICRGVISCCWLWLSFRKSHARRFSLSLCSFYLSDSPRSLSRRFCLVHYVNSLVRLALKRDRSWRILQKEQGDMSGGVALTF